MTPSKDSTLYKKSIKMDLIDKVQNVFKRYIYSKKYQNKDISGSYKCFIHNVDIVQQEGPTCGLSTILTADMYFNKMNGRTSLTYTSISDLLRVAKKLGITKQGELFSTENFHKLCTDTTITTNLFSSVYTAFNQTTLDFIGILTSGDLIAIPYDKD